MKKSFTFILGATLAVVGLAACRGGGGGGDEIGSQVIEAAKKKPIALVEEATPLVVGEVNELGGGENPQLQMPLLSLTTKQTVKIEGTDYAADIKWSISDASVVREQYAPQGYENHEFIVFDFPAVGGAAKEIKVKGEITYGSSKGEVEYSCKLLPQTIIYDDVTAKDFYKLNSAGTNFDFVYAESEDPNQRDFFRPNHDQKYFFCKMPGKVTYIAEDGNFFILQDGDVCVEVYAGSGGGRKLDTAHYSALKVGSYVTVWGDYGVYQGNAQVGYVGRVDTLSDHSAIAEPTAKYVALDSATLESAHQYTNYLMNKMVSITGTVATKPNKVSADIHWEFNVTFGSKTVKTYFDYHVTSKGATENEIYKSLAAGINGKNVGDSITVQGTLRYKTTSGNFKDNGAFMIVPLDIGDIA